MQTELLYNFIKPTLSAPIYYTLSIIYNLQIVKGFYKNFYLNIRNLKNIILKTN